MKTTVMTALALAGLFALGGEPASAQALRMGLSRSGEVSFQQNCATCHKPQGLPGGDPRAPAVETLRQYSPERVLEALTTGKMQVQGAKLSDDQKRDIAEWVSARTLGAAQRGDASVMTNRCPAKAPLKLSAPGWNGWGNGVRNDRFQTAAAGGLTAADLPRLKLKWAFGIPDGIQTFSQPTLFGGRLFFGADNGQIYSLDADSGCVRWSYLADAAVRTAPMLAPVAGVPGGYALFFGDMKGDIYGVNALTGELMWKTLANTHPLIRITGATTVFKGRVYVGTSSSEEVSANQKGYECCRSRGAVLALDAKTGAVIWKAFMVSEPQRLPDSEDGRKRWGPSGVSVWSAPTVDAKRRRLYVATGDSFSGDAGPLSDSVVALDLVSGKVVWSHQDTANDVWVGGCMSGTPGCPMKLGPDWDYGSSPMLQTRADGRDVVVAGHKGGAAIALDPDRNGAVIWRSNLAAKPPSNQGDILFGGATDPNSAYFSLQTTGGMTAVDLKNGRRRWFTPVMAPAPGQKANGGGAALTGVPGAVFSGGWDGTLRAYDTKDGRELWSFATMRPFDTANGVPAKGGSMGAPGATVAGGMLFVGSGYVGTGNGAPGNVLLAFSTR